MQEQSNENRGGAHGKEGWDVQKNETVSRRETENILPNGRYKQKGFVKGRQKIQKPEELRT